MRFLLRVRTHRVRVYVSDTIVVVVDNFSHDVTLIGWWVRVEWFPNTVVVEVRGGDKGKRKHDVC